MEVVNKYFEEETKDFDTIVRRLIPYYSELLKDLAIPTDINRLKLSIITLITHFIFELPR